jgi:hypothetical protein
MPASHRRGRRYSASTRRRCSSRISSAMLGQNVDPHFSPQDSQPAQFLVECDGRDNDEGVSDE